MQNFNWDDLRILIAIDGAGTLLGAARTIGVSHSTVYRRLAAVEKALQAKLFRRQENILVRTETADAILGQARRIEQEIEELARAATNADGKLSGSVQVAGPHAMIAGFVTRQLPAFYRAYPGVRATLRAELGVDLMLRGEADIGLRISMPVSDQLDIRRVANCHFGLYGTARLAAEVKKEARKGGPLIVPFVDFAEDHAEMPESRWLRKLFEGATPSLYANATPILHAAACAGVGVTALPCYVGDQLPGLQKIPTAIPGPAEGLFIVTRREQRNVARVRALVEFLTRAISANKAVFAGTSPRRRKPAWQTQA